MLLEMTVVLHPQIPRMLFVLNACINAKAPMITAPVVSMPRMPYLSCTLSTPFVATLVAAAPTADAAIDPGSMPATTYSSDFVCLQQTLGRRCCWAFTFQQGLVLLCISTSITVFSQVADGGGRCFDVQKVIGSKVYRCMGTHRRILAITKRQQSLYHGTCMPDMVGLPANFSPPRLYSGGRELGNQARAHKQHLPNMRKVYAAARRAGICNGHGIILLGLSPASGEGV